MYRNIHCTGIFLLTLLHSERPKLYTILVFLIAIGLSSFLSQFIGILLVVLIVNEISISGACIFLFNPSALRMVKTP